MTGPMTGPLTGVDWRPLAEVDPVPGDPAPCADWRRATSRPRSRWASRSPPCAGSARDRGWHGPAALEFQARVGRVAR